MSKIRKLPVVANLDEASRNAALYPSVISLAGTRIGDGALRLHDNRLYIPMNDTNRGGTRQSPSTHAVEKIFKFCNDVSTPLLVHCQYGQSRSTAVALGVAVYWGWDPWEAAEVLLSKHEINRAFVPNELLLSLFDNALGTNGNITKAGLHYIRI
jgi:predicted protein tyrosine phosphatase